MILIGDHKICKVFQIYFDAKIMRIEKGPMKTMKEE
jgi:hypothetical protein